MIIAIDKVHSTWDKAQKLAIEAITTQAIY